MIIVGIVGHAVTPNVISQLEVITSPLQGKNVCEVSKINQANQSQVTSTNMMDQYFHDNICSSLNATKVILNFSSFGVGSIGFFVVIYGVLKPKTKKDLSKRNNNVLT